VIEILGDSLPDGRYYFTATLGVNVAPSGGQVLPAGEFDLALTRPSLSETVIHNLITYKATTTVSAGSSALLRRGVAATRTRARAIPHVRDVGGVARHPRECAAKRYVLLRRGRSRENPQRVALGGFRGAPAVGAARSGKANRLTGHDRHADDGLLVRKDYPRRRSPPAAALLS
jgi:hypothetical protein